jgi:hypothetical protein
MSRNRSGIGTSRFEPRSGGFESGRHIRTERRCQRVNNERFFSFVRRSGFPSPAPAQPPTKRGRPRHTRTRPEAESGQNLRFKEDLVPKLRDWPGSHAVSSPAGRQRSRRSLAPRFGRLAFVSPQRHPELEYVRWLFLGEIQLREKRRNKCTAESYNSLLLPRCC